MFELLDTRTCEWASNEGCDSLEQQKKSKSIRQLFQTEELDDYDGPQSCETGCNQQ